MLQIAQKSNEILSAINVDASKCFGISFKKNLITYNIIK